MKSLRYFYDLHTTVQTDYSEMIALFVYGDVKQLMKRAKKVIGQKNGRDLHFMKTMCNQGSFKVTMMARFKRQSFKTTSLCTDGAYLYFYVSTQGGAMFKIGSGSKGTVPGQVYLKKSVSISEYVCWVYINHKLYLRNSSQETNTITVFNPSTFA